MRLPIYQVDAFADRCFSGNPAAVVLPSSELDAELMQAIAAENNLAETAFVVAEGDGLRIRWFTPVVEVDLCGHATLAAAHVLFEHRDHAQDEITFDSRSGLLRVSKKGERLYLNFPADVLREVDPPDALIQGLGARPLETYRGRDDFLAIFEDEATVAGFSPDMARIRRLESRGLIVSAPGVEADFVSRFFGPQVGVPEDPVTGSAHTSLIPYWSQRLGKKHLDARQISPRRGRLTCTDLDDRVEIGGGAVTYLVGEITV